MSFLESNFGNETEELDYELDGCTKRDQNDLLHSSDDEMYICDDESTLTSTEEKATTCAPIIGKSEYVDGGNNVDVSLVQTKKSNRNVWVHLQQSQEPDTTLTSDIWKKSISTYSTVAHSNDISSPNVRMNVQSNERSKPMMECSTLPVMDHKASTTQDEGPHQTAKVPLVIESTLPKGNDIRIWNGNKITALPYKDLRHLLLQKRTDYEKLNPERESYDELEDYSAKIAQQKLRREEYLREKENRRRQQELLEQEQDNRGRSFVKYDDDLFQ